MALEIHQLIYGNYSTINIINKSSTVHWAKSQNIRKIKFSFSDDFKTQQIPLS